MQKPSAYNFSCEAGLRCFGKEGTFFSNRDIAVLVSKVVDLPFAPKKEWLTES
jgi:hypothetical protein